MIETFILLKYGSFENALGFWINAYDRTPTSLNDHEKHEVEFLGKWYVEVRGGTK